MPHIVTEHSRGLDASHDLQAGRDDLRERFAAHPSLKRSGARRERTIAAGAGRIRIEPQGLARAMLLPIPATARKPVRRRRSSRSTRWLRAGASRAASPSASPT